MTKPAHRPRPAAILLEPLLMLLVFALAAAICLRVFVSANALSRQGERQDRALLQAENVVALLQAGHGDVAPVSHYLNAAPAEVSALQYTYCLDENAAPCDAAAATLYLVITRLPSPDGLGQAEVTVANIQDGQILLALPAAWQEPLSKEGNNHA